jgi:carboxylesterase
VAKGPPDWRNPEAARDHVDYPAYPTRSILQLRNLLSETRRILPQVKVPVLLVHSLTDESVPPHNAQRIFDQLGSADKQIFWVENSGHVITREPERQRIFEAAQAFILRVTQASGSSQ